MKIMKPILLIFLLIIFSLTVFTTGCGQQSQQPTQTSSTLAQTIITTSPPSTTPTTSLSMPPLTINFTKVSPCGSYDGVTGIMSGANPANYNVVVYVKVANKWWGPKPQWDNPLTPINPDGSWSCEIVTGGDDQNAQQVSAFLIPRNYSPPKVQQQSALPPELFNYPTTTEQRCK